jgi:hypothetical protein
MGSNPAAGVRWCGGFFRDDINPRVNNMSLMLGGTQEELLKVGCSQWQHKDPYQKLVDISFIQGTI